MKIKLIILSFLFSPLIFSQSNPPKYEFRGAWVATVANIDWPTDRNLSSGQQITELVQMFDKLKSAGINAVLFQIRTECDALYQSNYEPWSVYLTGRQGKAPDPFFDPLQFAIYEAHARGMELHAWFNPYRAVRSTGDYEIHESHVSQTRPDWILSFDKYQMLDPGHPGVREHVLNVMSDVLTRYDIDGIHFDDYFYPYTPKITSEDSISFARFNRGFTDIDDWRRDNINMLMKDIYEIIKAVKPHAKFGISPFGIVRNEYAGTDGFNSFDILYCDPLSWLEGQYVDYINPQIYWELEHEKAPYKKLLPWWSTVTNGRHLYIGQYSSRMAAKNYKGNRSELGDQIKLNRSTANVNGSVYFSAKSIYGNWNNFADTLKKNYYKHIAFPPGMEWKDNVPPEAPKNLIVTMDSVDVIIDWESAGIACDGDYPRHYVVYRFEGGEKVSLENPAKIIGVVPSAQTIFFDQLGALEKKEYTYIVASLDKLFNESKEYPAKKVLIE